MSMLAVTASAACVAGVAALAALGLYAERHRLPDQP